MVMPFFKDVINFFLIVNSSIVTYNYTMTDNKQKTNVMISERFAFFFYKYRTNKTKYLANYRQIFQSLCNLNRF